jgi:hypothetical protein
MSLFYARSSKIARMPPPRRPIAGLVFCLFLASCAPAALATAPAAQHTSTFTPFLPPTETAFLTATEIPPTASLTDGPTPFETATSTPVRTATATPLPGELDLDPADWHNWPIIPIVPEKARLIYQFGQAQGNDPHAFSVFGDCQSEPAVFMGVYETDLALAAGLPQELQETVAWFSGSFNRDAPTIRGGTTTGALLWPTWHQNKYTCTLYETPLQCELRIHKPSFVLIHVGTHYESHNDTYMREILDQLIAAGVVPILVSKADNRETDEAVNLAYAGLAVEYDLPFWNFWAALVSLENRGLYTRPEVPLQGDLYLTGQAQVLHRLTALHTLDIVRRAVSGP